MSTGIKESLSVSSLFLVVSLRDPLIRRVPCMNQDITLQKSPLSNPQVLSGGSGCKAFISLLFLFTICVFNVVFEYVIRYGNFTFVLLQNYEFNFIIIFRQFFETSLKFVIDQFEYHL